MSGSSPVSEAADTVPKEFSVSKSDSQGMLLLPHGGFRGLFLRSPLLAWCELVNFPWGSPKEMNCLDKLRLVQLLPPANIPGCFSMLADVYSLGACTGG